MEPRIVCHVLSEDLFSPPELNALSHSSKCGCYCCCRGLSEAAARSPCWGNGDDFWHQACILYLLHLALLKPRLHTVAAKRDRDDGGEKGPRSAVILQGTFING
jgi:hypothetical protein